MSDFTWVPDYGLEVQEKEKVLEAKFGDGYSQRAPDGINSIDQTFRLKFTRSPAVIDAIRSFLRSKKGSISFTWTPPGDTEIRVICKEFNRTHQDYGNHVLTCTFERVYE